MINSSLHQFTERTQFINRLDDIIIFHSLASEHMKQIARLMLNDLENRLMAQDIGLEVKDAVLAWLCEKGYDVRYGARPLRRVIEQNIENPIAGKILRKELKSGHIVVIDFKDGALVFDKHPFFRRITKDQIASTKKTY